ncbi:MAG: hypothetical protein VX990_03170 [Pseudomonadota bacterium]|nr:hypothetical protein [Pseudomonadota bacterium]
MTKVLEKDAHEAFLDGRPSSYIENASGLIITSIPTGYYYLKTHYRHHTSFN